MGWKPYKYSPNLCRTNWRKALSLVIWLFNCNNAYPFTVPMH